MSIRFIIHKSPQRARLRRRADGGHESYTLLRRLWMILSYKLAQLRCLRIRFNLLDTLAPRNHARHGRMLEAPRQRPLRHRHVLGNFFALDFFDLAELGVDLFRLVLLTEFSAESMTWLVFAAEQTAGEWHTRQHA